jgi:hypothetical protein
MFKFGAGGLPALITQTQGLFLVVLHVRQCLSDFTIQPRDAATNAPRIHYHKPAYETFKIKNLGCLVLMLLKFFVRFALCIVLVLHLVACFAIKQ